MARFPDKGERCGRLGPVRAAVAWLALAMLLSTSGCGGCRKTPEAQEQEKQAKKKKEVEPFEARNPALMPLNPASTTNPGWCKPGHWTGLVWSEVKANRGDFQGELQTEISGDGGRKLSLVAAPYEYEMTIQRPAALAKEHPKSLESYIWIPQNDARAVNFNLTASGGPTAIGGSAFLSFMPSFRYYFVVLTKAEARYKYLSGKLASIFRPTETGKADASAIGAGSKYYMVVTLPGSRWPCLPGNALYWTSIAYLLWDDADPAQWDVDQQRALLDWLHWGGQIIVSGPDALEQLRTSFLRPYLPATVDKSRSLAAKDLKPLRYWAPKPAAQAGNEPDSPQLARPWLGAVLKEEPHAKFLPHTNDLLVERQVGRGRIVASAFRLTGPELPGWRGYDCFFNACLLRRPAREYWFDNASGELQYGWAKDESSLSPPDAAKTPVGNEIPADQAPEAADAADGPNAHGGIGPPPPMPPQAVRHIPAGSPPLDAAKMTAVRFFARDAGVAFGDYAWDVANAVAPPSGTIAGVDGGDKFSVSKIEADIPFNECGPGLGAWNDFSPVAQAARTALHSASGITVPQRSFIIWVVAGYVCVLVPANWIVFRLLGRIEWAWFAAPLIAIGCTAVVIRQARLNIGFARSRNEIAVIEMQPGYSRAHVARYTALYTSLSTRYEFRLDDPGGQILPFPHDSSRPREGENHESRGELVCRRGDDTQLSGFRVGSNVTDFIHSEEMADFGGTVALDPIVGGGWRVTNGTAHPLENCRAVRREDHRFRWANIGSLDRGATAAVHFTLDAPPEPAAAGDPRKGQGPSDELSGEAIAKLALTSHELRSGEVCLVARVADTVRGLTVIPEAGQKPQAAVLVAHLDAGTLPPPEADRNLTP